MSILLTMREKLKQAIKVKAEQEKEILRYAIGRVDTLAANLGATPTDEHVAKEIRKIIKENNGVSGMYDDRRQGNIAAENEYLQAMLPQTLSVDEIIAQLEPIADQLRAEKSSGKATGAAVRFLKESGACFLGEDVSAAVEKMRQEA